MAIRQTPHQSALRLTASPQGEAVGWRAPQAFPLGPSVAEVFDFAAAVRCLVLEGGRAKRGRMRCRREQANHRGAFLTDLRSAPRSTSLVCCDPEGGGTDERPQIYTLGEQANIVRPYGEGCSASCRGRRSPRRSAPPSLPPIEAAGTEGTPAPPLKAARRKGAAPAGPGAGGREGVSSPPQRGFPGSHGKDPQNPSAFREGRGCRRECSRSQSGDRGCDNPG